MPDILRLTRIADPRYISEESYQAKPRVVILAIQHICYVVPMYVRDALVGSEVKLSTGDLFLVSETPDDIEEAIIEADYDASEVLRLREDCGEFYQCVAVLVAALDFWHTMPPDSAGAKAIAKLFDNLNAACHGDERPHNDLLPFSLTGGAAPISETSH